MILQDLNKIVTKSFDDLWKVKERDKSFELITPYITTSQKFVSVFISEREGEYIVSDGGWISDGAYGNQFDRNVSCFEKSFLHYQNAFSVRETFGKTGAAFFYKKTTDSYSIPSLVFDMATFISTIVSLSIIEYNDKEIETERNFNKSVRGYLEKTHPKFDWYFNEYVDRKKQVKVNAILRKKDSQLILFNFITGYNYHYFRNSISKTNIIFELAEKTSERQFIQKKIALLDDKANGYDLSHISIWLNHLITNTKTQEITWTKRKRLDSVI
jgi:hypothetical protein